MASLNAEVTAKKQKRLIEVNENDEPVVSIPDYVENVEENFNSGTGPKSKSVASPIYIGFGILYLILTFCQGVCLWTASGQNNNLNDQTAKNSLTNYLYNWSWAIGILGVITLIVLVLYGLLGKNNTANLLKFLIYWLVLMFIVNLILLGFGFYFLSVVLNSTDYSSGASNATNLKNTIIALLSFTGLILLIIIIMLVYYNYYGTSTYRISGFFGSDITPEDFFNDRDIARVFDGEKCKNQYKAYKAQQPFIKQIENAFPLNDPITQSAFENALKLGKIKIQPKGKKPT
jgi:hypothetical protein